MTFGPLPCEPAVEPARPRLRRYQARRDVYALAGLCLSYPDDDLLARRQAILDACRALPSGRPRDELAGFAEWFAGAEPGRLRVAYVQTFDHKRRTALDVTFARYGDARLRGGALLALRQAYQAAGFAPTRDELPDHLPTVLQFAALAGDDEADRVLASVRVGIELIARALADRRSAYAPVLASVVACLPAADDSLEAELAAVVADGPRSELVGASAPAQCGESVWEGALA
ncbi:MAG: nitrate reductase molybdenum cofactor assembly chaperone [Propionibacteriaceae bacterium]|jgi:nitrate reductase delta subunit|nr:nitrate reductase molybdenum cofactor assembly chaperone [Propionibacteriaceae bacterium]